jgi:hypothetical protein
MILATHAVKPSLTKLRVTSNNPWVTFWQLHIDRATQIIITDAVTTDLALWKNSLTSLKLNCLIDPPHFLLKASKFQWPHLYRMEMTGKLDMNPRGIPSLSSPITDPVKACDDVLHGLTAALPSMPSLTKVSTRFRNPDDHFWAFSLCLDLDARNRRPESRFLQLTSPLYTEKAQLTPCRPVADGNALALAHGIVLPGHLVTQLQSTVWQHRKRELSVFCCTDGEGHITQVMTPCGQWDRETHEWELVLENGLDALIYRLGQYWEGMEL